MQPSTALPVATTAPTVPAQATAAGGGPIQLTATQGLSAADKALVDAALSRLSPSPTARRILSAFEGTGVRFVVMSDAEFRAANLGNAEGGYNDSLGVIVLRREQLQNAATQETSVASLGTIVHEAAHAVDIRSGIETRFLGSSAAAAYGANASRAALIGLETRGHLAEGAVYRELNIKSEAGPSIFAFTPDQIALTKDPALVAAVGGSYEQVWRSVSGSSVYNPTGAILTPTTVGSSPVM